MDHYQNKVAVLLYLYHTDLWNEIRDLLRPIKKYIHLYLGLCEEQDNLRIIAEAEKYFKNIYVQEFPNAGADIRPFLHQIMEVDSEQEPIFIKIHSKKSMIGSKNHINWRSVLLDSLIGSKKIFLNNKTILLSSDNIGMLCNPKLIMSHRELLNTEKIQLLCNKLKIQYDALTLKQFCAGTIFAGNTRLFQQYFNINAMPYIDPLLLTETNKVTDEQNGSFCHALERIFGYLVEFANKKIIGTNLQDYNHTKIINNKAPKGYFNLIINYDNSCYITDDLNVYGYILKKNKKEMLIRWTHLDTIMHQLYRGIGHDTYIKSNK